jgi:holin-like protein
MRLLLIVLSVTRHGEGFVVVRVSERLLSLLPLLFVPAGTGVIALMTKILPDVLPLLAGLVLSWAAGFAVTVLISRFTLKAEDKFRSRTES